MPRGIGARVRQVVLVLAVAVSAVLAQQPAVTVVKYESQPNTGNGEYFFSYELSDGSSRTEQAVLQGAGTPDEYLLVTGSYAWTSPEGLVTQVDYTADNTGYHPVVRAPGSAKPIVGLQPEGPDSAALGGPPAAGFAPPAPVLATLIG